MAKPILFIIAAMYCSWSFAQNSPLTLTPGQPEAGKEINFVYTGELAKEGTEIKLFWENIYEPIATEIVYENNKITGKAKLPDSAKAIAFLIKNKKEKDNNKSKGYIYQLYKDNKPIAGSNISKASLLNASSYAGLDIKTDIKKILALYDKEFEQNPHLRTMYYSQYLANIYRDKDRKEEAITLATKAFQDSLKNKKEGKTLYNLIYVASDGDRDKNDSLTTLVIQKFPKGEISFNKKMWNIVSLPPDEFLKEYENLKRDYPQELIDKSAQYLNIQLLSAYRKKQNLQKFEETISKIDKMSSKASQYNEMAWELALAGKHLDKAKKYSEKSVETLDLAKNEPAPGNYTAEQWHNSLQYDRGNYFDTYALILLKQGNKKDALKYQEQAALLTDFRNAEINEKLIAYLLDNGRNKDALQYAENAIQKRKSNQKIDSLYNIAYVKTNGSETGLSEAKSKMKAAIKAEYTKELTEKMINETAPDFTLANLDDKKVKLSDLKGKIVILDFWATWCGPCLASFPGMQRALENAKDKNADFYFINTSEQGTDEKRKEKINALLEKSKYTFNVLLDQNNTVHDAYKVNGIPTKIIIGKDGNIKFHLVGYSGSEQSVVDEMDAIIDILQ